LRNTRDRDMGGARQEVMVRYCTMFDEQKLAV